MAIPGIALNTQVVNQAYGRSLLFDKMKKKREEPGEETTEKEHSGDETLSLPDQAPKEKPKPNTVPFKTGFVFEYAHDNESGPIIVTISDAEKIKVDLKDAQAQDERKRTIRSIVMLGLGKISRDDFNGLLTQGKQALEQVTQELRLMGVRPEIPFGLGDESYYVNGRNLLSRYKPMDIKG